MVFSQRRAYPILRDKQITGRAARLVAGVKKQEHITPVLQMLYWLPIRARIDFKILLIESFHSPDQQPYWITETKETISIKIEF